MYFNSGLKKYMRLELFLLGKIVKISDPQKNNIYPTSYQYLKVLQ